MIKRLFWLVVAGVAAALGINYFKNKAKENPEQFSTEALVEKFIEVLDKVKLFVGGYWQGFSSGEKLNDTELEKIFETKSFADPKTDSTIKATDISLN